MSVFGLRLSVLILVLSMVLNSVVNVLDIVSHIPTYASVEVVGGITNITATLDYCFKDVYCIKDLLAEREGFAGNATGGLGGRVYFVTSLEDYPANPQPGTLRHAASQEEPLWIFFLVNGTIYLRAPVFVKSHKTIDGRGAQITITDNTVFIRDVENVIVTNIRFDSVRRINVDGMEIRRSTNIWVHRCDFTNWSDGVLDIPEALRDRPTLITISWCRFWNTDKTILIGGSATRTTDRNLRVTMHHNFFFLTRERRPRIRFGVVDYYNNYVFSPLVYFLGGTLNGTIHAEANIFEFTEGSGRVLAYCNLSAEPPMNVILKNNLIIPSNASYEFKGDCRVNVFDFERPYPANVEPATEDLKLRIMRFAGTSFPAYPRILVDHPQSFTEDYRWEVPLPYNTSSLDVGFAIDIPPYRSPEEEPVEIVFDPGDGTKYRLIPYVNISTDPTITSPGRGFRIRHTYQSPGVYMVTATVKTKGGDTYFLYGTVFVATPVGSGSVGIYTLPRETVTTTATATFTETATVVEHTTFVKTVTERETQTVVVPSTVIEIKEVIRAATKEVEVVRTTTLTEVRQLTETMSVTTLREVTTKVYESPSAVSPAMLALVAVAIALAIIAVAKVKI